jgi:hypothetical protein
VDCRLCSVSGSLPTVEGVFGGQVVAQAPLVSVSADNQLENISKSLLQTYLVDVIFTRAHWNPFTLEPKGGMTLLKYLLEYSTSA